MTGTSTRIIIEDCGGLADDPQDLAAGQSARRNDPSAPTAAQLPLTARVAGRWNGFYALNVYQPAALVVRAWRSGGRQLRGKARIERPTRLAKVPWSAALQRHRLFLTEFAKQDGNVSIGELAVLAQAAAGIHPGSEVIEIGTFDGRTCLNLALNAPPASPIFTIDLPPNHPTRFQLEPGEERYVDKPHPGSRLRRCAPAFAGLSQRITQLLGDSASFDWSSHYRKAGLVFVDGSHAYDYVRSDSATAMRLVAANGTILWHDYGVWNEVTRALEDLEQALNLGLRHIRGTSLVLWRAPADHQ
jgi:hypothetical protein